MLTKMKRRTLTVSLTSTLMLVSTGSFGAVTVLKNCFGAPQTYSIDYHHEFTSTENVANNDYDIPGHWSAQVPTRKQTARARETCFRQAPSTKKPRLAVPLTPAPAVLAILRIKLMPTLLAMLMRLTPRTAARSPQSRSMSTRPRGEICLPCSNRACLKQKKKATYAAMTPGLTVVPHRNASFAGTSWPCCCT